MNLLRVRCCHAENGKLLIKQREADALRLGIVAAIGLPCSRGEADNADWPSRQAGQPKPPPPLNRTNQAPEYTYSLFLMLQKNSGSSGLDNTLEHIVSLLRLWSPSLHKIPFAMILEEILTVSYV